MIALPKVCKQLFLATLLMSESGLIDHIRSVVMNNSGPEDLSKAKVIWGDTNRYLYRAHMTIYPNMLNADEK